MPLSLRLSLALLSQPSTGQESTEEPAQVAEALDREYQGPRSVRLPEKGLTAIAPSAPKVAPMPPAGTRSTADGSLPPATFVDVSAYPPPAASGTETPLPPRTLTTIDGPGPQAALRRGSVAFRPGLQVRTRLGAVSPFRLDASGNEIGEGPIIAGRVRWRPELLIGERESLRLVGMVDVANGRWAPGTIDDPIVRDIARNGQPPVPTDPRQGLGIVDPRELYLEWTSRSGVLRFGQQAYGWGLGLVFNDGNDMDRFGDLKFGDDGDGSLLERLSFASQPRPDTHDLVLAIAADLVYRDPNADLVQGDLAGQGLLSLRWEPQHRPGAYLGGYIAYRHQKSADDRDATQGDDRLELFVADVAGRGYRHLQPKLAFMGAFEAVIIGGRTTLLRGEHDEHRVVQGGIAARGFIGDPRGWLAGADTGWFSGDADPSDDRQGGFEAAPGYTAGLLLFQHVRGWQSARSARLADAPQSPGQPTAEARYLASEGRVGNVMFVHPKARWAFAERFEVWGGPLIAAASSKRLDAYEAEVRSRFLATELDLGLRTQYDFRALWLQAGVQGGVLFPGPALEDRDGVRDEPTYGGWLRVELRY